MKALRVGIISDTHASRSASEVPSQLFDRLQEVDHILHAGDIVSLPVLEALEAIAPLTAVAGNMDPPELRRRLKRREIIELAGRVIGLSHGHQPHALQDHYIAHDYNEAPFDLFFGVMREQLPGAEIIIFGHFHRPVVRTWRNRLFINPGSVAPPHREPTFALLDLPTDGVAPVAQIVVL